MLNDVIGEATTKVQPPSDKGKRLRIYYATQAAAKPPTFVIFVNKAELFHFSYQRYLENQLRAAFGFEGTPIPLYHPRARRKEIKYANLRFALKKPLSGHRPSCGKSRTVSFSINIIWGLFMVWLVTIAAVAAAYLIGSVNSSIIISKLIGTDIRGHGSGNAGATNMLRTYGKRVGVLTLLCDVLKGILAVGITFLIMYLISAYFPFYEDGMAVTLMPYLCGIAVVVGHNYPIFFSV